MSSRYILGCLVLFINHFSFADSGLVDPVTKKEISYYVTYVKTKAYKLNPFEDLEVQFPVIKNNQLCNDKLKAYILGLTTDENFRARFKDHAQQAIAAFMKYSKNTRDFSEYDRKLFRDQNVVMRSIQAKVVYYYNNLLCVQIEPGYIINQKYDSYDHRIEMVQCIYVNLTTGSISGLLDLCPKKYQANFINYLTNEKNKVIPATYANTDDEYESEADEPDEDGSGINVIMDNDEDKAYLNEKIDLSDIVFDVNAMNFPVVTNASNTLYTKGKPYIIYAAEDSIYKYLPWTLNRNKTKFSTQLKSENVNKNVLIYDQDFYFLQDEYLRRYFEAEKNKQGITIYWRQNFAGDTMFKKNERISFNTNNTVSEIASDFSNAGKPGSVKKYNYVEGRLKRVENKKDNKITESIDYFYNSAGYLVKFTKDVAEETHEDHTYSYEKTSVHECIAKNGSNTCYTYLFDSLGNYRSRYKQGEKPPYLGVFSGNKIMAKGDMLYSYNANDQVESIERDRGRYYTSYFYDSKKRICLILKYDGKQITNKDIIEYDVKDRIILMTSANFSYGKLSTQVQHKIEYNN